jgi:hypothetical protein
LLMPQHPQDVLDVRFQADRGRQQVFAVPEAGEGRRQYVVAG